MLYGSPSHHYSHTPLSVLRPDKVSHSLRLALIVMLPITALMHIMPMVIIPMRIMAALRRAHIFHLINTAALRAPLNRAIPARREPDDHVAVGRAAGAAQVLLVAEGLDDDGVVEGALTRGVQRLHVEDVDALHFAKDFEALETGGLFEVGGDCAGFGAGGEEVVLGGDFWGGSWC